MLLVSIPAAWLIPNIYQTEVAEDEQELVEKEDQDERSSEEEKEPEFELDTFIYDADDF